MTTRRTLISAALALGAALSAPGLLAQGSYPSRTIRLVVPFAPGGGGDVIGRYYAQKLSEAMKVPVIVDNRPGASTMIGSDLVAKSPGDGYTLLLNVPLLVQTPHLFSKMSYDPLQDLTPVIDVNNSPLWLAVSTARTQARTFQEFMAEARRKPREFSYASIGPGSSGHLLGNTLNEANHLEMVHVPFKGSTPATLALVGGEINTVFLDYVTLKPHVDSGKVRLLAVTGTRRSPMTPDVPTLAELGYPGFETNVWGGLFVSSKTPPEIVERLNAHSRAILAQPELSAKWRELGYEVGGLPQAQFAALVRAEYDRWGGMIRKAGVKLD